MNGTEIIYKDKPALVISENATHYFIEQKSKCFTVKKSEVDEKIMEVVK